MVIVYTVLALEGSVTMTTLPPCWMAKLGGSWTVPDRMVPLELTKVGTAMVPVPDGNVCIWTVLEGTPCCPARRLGAMGIVLLCVCTKESGQNR